MFLVAKGIIRRRPQWESEGQGLKCVKAEKKNTILFHASHKTLKHAQSIDNETSDIYWGFKKNLGAIEKKSAEIRPFEVGGWADPLISLGILPNP